MIVVIPVDMQTQMSRNRSQMSKNPIQLNVTVGTAHVVISGCAESRFPESFGLLVRERDGGVAGAAAGEAGDGDGAAGAADGTPLADTLPAPPPWSCPPRPPVAAPTAGARGGRQRGWRPQRGRQPWPRELRPKRWWEGSSGGDVVGGGGCLVTDVCADEW